MQWTFDMCRCRCVWERHVCVDIYSLSLHRLSWVASCALICYSRSPSRHVVRYEVEESTDYCTLCL